MRITLISISLLLSLSVFSQTADVVKGCAPLEVHFTPPVGATTFYWDFKDGGSSVLSNPSNIFTTPGTYAVEFHATPTGPLVGTVVVTVWPKPDPDILATPDSGCKPLNVLFTNNTVLPGDIQVLNQSWVFGDGSSVSGIASPFHTYNQAGEFNVSLELQTNYPSCNVTEVFTGIVTVGQKPVVDFTTVPNPAVACNPPLEVSFVNTTLPVPGYTYAWVFGNGNTSTAFTPPAQTYTTNGTFTVKLTVTDTLGCEAFQQKLVIINSPTAQFNAPDTVCLNAQFQILNSSANGTYAWNFGPNAIPATSTVKNPSLKFTTKGFHTVTLLVTSLGCTSTATAQIYVDFPDTTVAVLPISSCSDPTLFSYNAVSPDASAWEWTFADGTSSNIKNPTYTWHNPDTTGYTPHLAFLNTVVLVIENPSGCKATTTIVDTIWIPNARTIPDVQHGCAPLNVVFSDSSRSREPIIKWTWLFDDGTPPLITNNGLPVPHTFTSPGEYEVRLVIENSAGCSDTSFVVLIEVGELLTGDFTADQFSICPGDSIHFTSLINDPRIDAWHFSSDEDRQWHCFQNSDPYWTYKTLSGPMDVTLTLEYNGCMNSITKTDYIEVKGPIAHMHYETICPNSMRFHFTNESSGATQYTWTLGDGSDTTAVDFWHTYAARGAYTVTLKAENPLTGCPASFESATVYATQIKASFDLPAVICADVDYPLDGSASQDVMSPCGSYTWYFSDTRPEQVGVPNWHHAWANSDTQTVSLVVFDINGCRDTISDTIRVYNQYPAFQLDDDYICLPGLVNFDDNSTGDTTIVSWQWNFGDGLAGVGSNPGHTYNFSPPAGNFYVVELTATDAVGCPKSTKDTVYLYNPVSNILTFPTPANICEGATVSFTATDYLGGGSHLEWDWNFDDGSTGSGQVVQHVFNQHGTYNVNLHYTEMGSGCEGDTSAVVNVQNFPHAAFTSNVDTVDIICYPQNIQFADASTSDYPVGITWDLGNGVLSAGPTAATVYPKGTYTATIVATTAYGCADTTERSFIVVGPEGTFVLSPAYICKGDSVLVTIKDTIDVSSFSWSFGDGTTLDNVSPSTHTYDFQPPSGSTLIKLVLRGEDDACAITVEKPLQFSPIHAEFTTTDSSVCLGIPHIFSNTSIASDDVQWIFDDGSTSNATNPMHEFSAEGLYEVMLIATDLPLGCMDTVVHTVSVTELPDIEAFGDTICIGETGKIGLLSPQPTYTYVWEPSNLVTGAGNTANVEVVPTETTVFTVTVTDADGCQGTSTATVTVIGAYDGAMNLDTVVAKGSVVQLPVADNPDYKFNWEPFVPAGTPPTVTAPDTTVELVLTVGNDYGCPEQTFNFTIRVVPEDILVPTAFTPDGDSYNDVFRLIAKGEQELVEVTELSIYDRWGNLVYKGAGVLPNVAWDGKIDGKPAASDVYIWVASVRFLTGKTVALKGDVTLIR